MELRFVCNVLHKGFYMMIDRMFKMRRVTLFVG